jgi:catechol 2,3-dioxygenase-like lactoylglutathione lyase family enzyme
MRLRIARHTDRLEEVVAFYRDRLGFPELGRFEGHDGYDGVILGVPGTGTHLELTSGGGLPAPDPHRESLLVLYLDSPEQRDALADRIGVQPVQPANPYWIRHGVAFADPDGFQVILTVG